MRRLHVIDNYDRMGGEVYFRHEEKYRHDPELMEAFHCGVKQGWKEAMEEVESGGYNERRDWRMPPMMRENDHIRMPEDDEVMYRRRRMNGRFY